MSRRVLMLTLVIVEALLWSAVNGLPFFRFTDQIRLVIAGSMVAPLFTLYLVALALAVIIGALSRGWQGAVALNLIASLLAVALALLFYRPTTGFGMDILYLMAPLAALGWFGWLLRFVRAELTA